VGSRLSHLPVYLSEMVCALSGTEVATAGECGGSLAVRRNGPALGMSLRFTTMLFPAFGDWTRRPLDLTWRITSARGLAILFGASPAFAMVFWILSPDTHIRPDRVTS
jgi:hypothetical protein